MVTAAQIGSREARARWRDLLDAAMKGESDTIIERNGRPIAALIPFDLYDKLREEIDELRAARRAQSIYESWKLDPSMARPWEEVVADLRADGLLDDDQP